MRKLEWTKRAIFDYESLTEYLFSTWNEQIASGVLVKINYQITRVNEFPFQFPILIPGKDIRRCVASPQTSILFIVKQESIILLSIFDNRLNPVKRP